MEQIFLCYAREDEAQVRDLYARLRALGFELWMAKVSLGVGQKWTREIPKALRASSVVLVCLSQTSVAKGGDVQREFKLALDTRQEMPAGMIHTLPVRLDACDVPEQFYALHRWNLFEGNGFAHLVEGIRVEAPATAEPTVSQPDREPTQLSNDARIVPPAEDREETLRTHIAVQIARLRRGSGGGISVWRRDQAGATAVSARGNCRGSRKDAA